MNFYGTIEVSRCHFHDATREIADAILQVRRVTCFNRLDGHVSVFK